MSRLSYISLCALAPPLLLAVAEECGTPEGRILSCPTPDVPDNFTSCCPLNRTLLTCCPPIPSYDDSLVMMISIFVILLCLFLSVCFVVCCFWSPCPLYSVCRMNYTYGDIVAYTKEEEALSLPPESNKKTTNYTPLQVTMKLMNDE